MRTIITTALIITAIAAMAQTERTDTLMISQRPSRAVITESPDGLKVTVITNNGDTTTESVYLQPYSPDSQVKSKQSTNTGTATTFSDGVLGVKVKNRHWGIISGGLGIGLVNASGQPSGLGLQWGKSFEISWFNALAMRYSNRWLSVSLGLGFDWRNYKITTSGHRLCPNGEGGIGIAPYPDGTHHGASRIKVFSLGIPLLYTQKIPSTTLSVTLGGILNFNTHASLKTWYTNPDGNHTEEYAEGFHHRRVTADLFGSLNFFKGNGIYVRYSPQTVLQGHNSPQFKPLSIGIILFL